MYTKVPNNMNFAERELPILGLWQENRVFEQSIEQRVDKPIFTFFDGPPTANGEPHIGHVLTRAVKDIFPRYKTMKGFHVLRKAGWDTHGLPVELEVEKQLGIDGKPEIEKYGVEAFINECKASVWKYEGLWRTMSERVGFWADMDNPYVTYHNEYIESVWWALSEIWKKDLIYKSYRVVPYCPRCGTPLSSHEVAQAYQDVTEPSVYVRFQVTEKENEYLLAWTTTPWTLPSNVGLCVNPFEKYVRVAHGEHVYIMAAALLDDVLHDSYEILETMEGNTLQGIKYIPLFDFAKLNDENYCKVVCDTYVTLTDGTGIVHIAPAFGEDDSRVSKDNSLPLVQLVNDQGCFVEEVTPWAGMFVKDADKPIVEDLDVRGLLFKEKEYTHPYPFCWRCDTPLLYYARDAWFIKMSTLRHELMECNNTVNWLPSHMREGRFGNFLENVIDWSISRERYWGTPLPIWECECGHRHCVGSIAELKELGKNVPDEIELHKPYIDEVILTCAVCGEDMKRTPEVIDCWFDSGAMPFAQWHYPFENEDLFKKQFPADYISEAIDQTRGWFYSLMAISTLLFEKSPYKNVIVLGHVQDKHGRKMSKHLGNGIDPMGSLSKHGADAVRWFFFVNSAPWSSSRYSDDAVAEAQRKFMGTLWNTYAFYVLYAEIDQFNPFTHKTKDLSIMDKWILSKLNSLVKRVDDALSRYELTEPARAMEQFVDELSNWYLRRSRERYWTSGMPQDKINAYKVLHNVLVTLSKLAAPFVPFMTELMYQNLVFGLDRAAPLSVHLCDYPEADLDLIDSTLEADMANLLSIVSLGRAARNAAATKNRQPLSAMMVSSKDEMRIPSAAFLDIARDELNIKDLRFVNNADEYMDYRIKPQLRTLGPRYGKLVPKITEALNVDSRLAVNTLSNGQWKCEVDSMDIVIEMEDVLIETVQREGFATVSDHGITVALDTQLTTQLIEEGQVRELVSKWQNLRREAGFDVSDHIIAGYANNNTLSGVIAKNQGFIAGEILANNLIPETPPSGAYEKEWDVNGEKILLWAIKVA